MSTIELKVIQSEKRVDTRIFDLSSPDQQEQLRRYLRVIDRDFNPKWGAWDRNLTYVIPRGGIFLKTVAASGPITREALNSMLGYKREYPV